MKQTKRVTIKDIAANAGVSTQTVSRVLNNHPDVSPETLERVKRVIKETGYAPNILARSLIRGRSYMLGVVAYGLKYYGPSRMITGIEGRAAELGYSMFLHLIHDPETDDVEYQINSLLAHQVDGIIWAISEIGNNRAWAHKLRQNFNVPLVFVGGMEKPISLSTVGIDNHAIGELATQHLIDGGAKNIGIITGPLNWWEAQQRQQGWRDVLKASGMDDKEQLVAVGDWNARSGEQAYIQLLEQDPSIDAIFASNDQMACGALHAAHLQGRRIPEDLSIVGVDNISEGAHFWPPLTTVRQGLQEAGVLAVNHIDQLIKQANESQAAPEIMVPSITWLQPELIVRESSRTSKTSSLQEQKDKLDVRL